jgi:hypothetical protein
MRGSTSAIARVRAATLAATMVMAPALGCDCNCDAPEPMESGDYVVVSPSSGNVHPGDEWVIGGALHVDRDADVATIRYERDGTTYEVRYRLDSESPF